VTRIRPLIAVVDDEEPIRRALCRLIRAAGLDAEAFSCGAAFLASVDGNAPDCVVLDLHMPGMSGFDVLARLADLGPSVPVVAITGYDTPEARERVLATGATAYLNKPVDADALLDAIASALAVGADRPSIDHSGELNAKSTP